MNVPVYRSLGSLLAGGVEEQGRHVVRVTSAQQVRNGVDEGRAVLPRGGGEAGEDAVGLGAGG